MSDRTAHRLLLLILLCSVVVRLLHYLEMRNVDIFLVPFSDCLHYKSWAEDLLRGTWGVGDAYWMGPLYPHVLAVIYLIFGEDSFAPQFLQWLLSVLNIYLVFLIGRRLISPGVALLAALFYALYGPAAFYAGMLLMATLLTTLFLLIVLQTIRSLEKPGYGNLFWLGLLVGITGLARGNVLLLLVTLPFLLAASVWGTAGMSRQHLGKLVLVMWMGTAAAILPVTLRNLVVGDDLVLLTTNGGMNFYLGQRADLQGVFGPLDPEMEVQFDPSGEIILERELGRDLKGSEVSRIYFGRALRLVADQPWDIFKLYWVKTYRFWNGYEIPQIASVDYWRHHSLSLQLLWMPFTFLAAGGLLGLLLGRGRWRLILGTFIGTYFLSLLPFFVTARYRLPIVPLLCIGTAALLVQAGGVLVRHLRSDEPHTWRGAGFRRGLLPLLMILVLSVALLPRWADFDRAEAMWGILMNRAGRLARSGDRAGALAAVRAADAAYPDYVVTHLKRGAIHQELQEYDEALQSFQQAELEAPLENIVPYRVGRTLHRLERYDEALEAFERCIALDPDWPRCYFGAAMAHRERGDFEAAIAAMQQAVAAEPGAVYYRNNLASLYAETGQLDRAQATLQELVEDFPVYVKGWINLALVSYNRVQLDAASEALDRADAIEVKEPAEEQAIRGIRKLIAAGPPLR